VHHFSGKKWVDSVPPRPRPRPRSTTSLAKTYSDIHDACHFSYVLLKFSHLHRRLAVKGILFWGCPYVRVSVHDHIQRSLWTRYLTKRLCEFHQIYNLDEVGNKDEWIRFWGQKVKGQGHDETKYGQNHLFKTAYFRRRHTGWRFAVEHHLIHLYSPFLVVNMEQEAQLSAEKARI